MNIFQDNYNGIAGKSEAHRDAVVAERSVGRATICITNAGGVAMRCSPFAQRDAHPHHTMSQSTPRGRFLATM